MFNLGRRELITLLGGAPLAWPLAVRGQQAPKVHRVGLFMSSVPVTEMMGPNPIDPVSRAFVHRLRELGYIEGQNLVLERWSAEGNFGRIDEIATELVSRKPDVILTGSGDFVAQALQRVTKSVPVVFPNGTDPIGAGIIASLARPGGNITGLLALTGPEFETKRLQLLKEAAPKTNRVAFLGLKEIWEGPVGQEVQAAARTLGITLIHVGHTPGKITDAFAVMIEDRPDALFVAFHPQNYANRQLIADFALEHRIPGMYPYGESVLAGGLMSYTFRTADLYRRAADFVDKILKGGKPADIPVERPTKLELVINLKTAKILGLEIPDKLLALADSVIE
jgi:putative tryptophan/tyrosine transport system substrate-binding protein